MVNIVQVKPFQAKECSLDRVRNIFQQNYQECRIDLENIRSIPHHGQTSQLTSCDVVIREDLDGSINIINVIVKTLEEKETRNGFGVKCQFTRFMTREVLFYTKLFPNIIKDNICNKSAQNIVPKCYYGITNENCANTGCFLPHFARNNRGGESGILVLEDLTKRFPNVTIIEKSQLLDKEHLECALTALAHLHGVSFKWVEKTRHFKENFGSLESILKYDSWYLSFCFKTIFKLIRKMLAEFLLNRKENKSRIDRLDRFLKDEALNLIDAMWFNKRRHQLETLTHGDFWASNLLYRYNDAGKPIETFIVDFQHVAIGSPFRDILSLVYSSTTSEFRAKHMDGLLKHYFKHFQRYSRYQNSFDLFYQYFCKDRKFGFVWGLYIVSVGNLRSVFYRKI